MAVANGLHEYLDHLATCLNESGSCEHTKSGFLYDGCGECEVREILFYLFGPQGMDDGNGEDI